MDRNRAVRLLEKWISFNGMDHEDGWEVAPAETPVWPRVQNTRRAIEYAIHGKQKVPGSEALLRVDRLR